LNLRAVFVVLNEKIAYNLKTIGQILMQFHMTMVVEVKLHIFDLDISPSEPCD